MLHIKITELKTKPMFSAENKCIYSVCHGKVLNSNIISEKTAPLPQLNVA